MSLNRVDPTWWRRTLVIICAPVAFVLVLPIGAWYGIVDLFGACRSAWRGDR